MLIHVRKHVDWTVAGLQSFVSRFVSYWFKRPKFFQMICSIAYCTMKGAGLSVQDLKLLFHVTPNKLLNDKNVTTL